MAVRKNTWDRSGAVWEVGPEGVRSHEEGLRASEAERYENERDTALRAILARAVDALTKGRGHESAS